jgi:hypothetical protein
MATTAVEDAFVAVEILVDTFGKENVFIISKCGEVIEDKTRKWLVGNDLYPRTGFDLANLYFCRTRAEKAPLAEELGLTDYIDDHADVLQYMKGIVERRYLFGPQRDETQDTTGLILVEAWWMEALTAILPPNTNSQADVRSVSSPKANIKGRIKRRPV